MSRLGGSPVRIAMNELSNHDHSRFLTRTNRTVGRTESRGPKAAEENVNKAVFREAVVIQMTWPGAPTIYYGDEAGVCGWTDPDNRRTYPWGHEDSELIAFHKAIIKLHKQLPALMKGSYKSIYGEYNIIAYARFYGDSRAVVVINNNEYEKEVQLDVWQAGVGYSSILRQAILTDQHGYTTDCGRYQAKLGKISIKMPAYSGTILVME